MQMFKVGAAVMLVFFPHVRRYPDGQSRLVPAVCYLNLFLPGHESSGPPFWLAVGLREQHGELHGVHVGHLPVEKHGLDHNHGSSHRLCLCHAADFAVHTHLSLPQRERGKNQICDAVQCHFTP